MINWQINLDEHKTKYCNSRSTFCNENIIQLSNHINIFNISNILGLWWIFGTTGKRKWLSEASIWTFFWSDNSQQWYWWNNPVSVDQLQTTKYLVMWHCSNQWKSPIFIIIFSEYWNVLWKKSMVHHSGCPSAGFTDLLMQKVRITNKDDLLDNFYFKNASSDLFILSKHGCLTLHYPPINFEAL